MNSALERLLSLRVSDVMTAQVFTVSANATMEQAAETLRKHDVSGAPVVDEFGRCVGVLSATDFVKKAAAPGTEHQLVGDGDEGPLHIETSASDRVAARMSPAVQTILAEATLLNAARTMCAAHVHRLPVLDSQSRVSGMITSLDVVAALVQAIEE